MLTASQPGSRRFRSQLGPRGNLNLRLRRRSIRRIVDQVRPHLAQRRAARVNHRRRRVKLLLHRDLLDAQLVPQNRNRALQAVVHVQLLPGERSSYANFFTAIARSDTREMLSSIAHTSETLDTSASSQFSASEKLPHQSTPARTSALPARNPISTSDGAIVKAFSTPASCSHSASASSASACSSELIAGAWQLFIACCSRLVHALHLLRSLWLAR